MASAVLGLRSGIRASPLDSVDDGKARPKAGGGRVGCCARDMGGGPGGVGPGMGPGIGPGIGPGMGPGMSVAADPPGCHALGGGAGSDHAPEPGGRGALQAPEPDVPAATFQAPEPGVGAPTFQAPVPVVGVAWPTHGGGAGGGGRHARARMAG
jgi:hypothetical protein